MSDAYVDEMVETALSNLPPMAGIEALRKALQALAHNVRIRADELMLKAFGELARQYEGQFAFRWSFKAGLYKLEIQHLPDLDVWIELTHCTVSQLLQNAHVFCKNPSKVADAIHSLRALGYEIKEPAKLWS